MNHIEDLISYNEVILIKNENNKKNSYLNKINFH